MTDPTTSVLIPCYERSAVLARAIASVLAQTDDDFEVVVGDDGSTEDLVAVAESFHDARVRVARREVNGGISAGRNVARSIARGRLVAYLDSDDEWYPQHLATVRAALEAAPPGVSAASTAFEMRYPSGRIDVRVPEQHDRLIERIVRGVDLSAGSTMLVRTAALDEIGPWPEDIPRNEDYDWFLRMAEKGHELVVVPDVTVIIHADDRSALDREALARSHRIILERHLPALADERGLGRHLRAKLHEERAWAAWRGGDKVGCAREVGAAVVLDPVARGGKLARSALRRAGYARG
ncbi:glycosyltransferase family 2 protein [Aquihabitans sp. McL0605]|uniref:glycosyltransferase family 2 protein n=1 Tax=Aquihabitans sp. McL0605 TaxID=3415671 RepID=UPI003CF37BF7